MLLDRFRDGVGCVGVEFTDRFVRLLQVRSCRGQLEVAGVSTQPMTETSAPGADQEALVARLRSAVVAGGFAGRNCTVSLPRADVQLYATRLPNMPEEELAEAVRWEAAERLSLDRVAIEADFIRTGARGEGGRDEVLIVATAREVVERRLNAVMSAGLRPMAVDVHFGALARLFSRQHRREADQASVRAVVEVGDTATTVLVLHGDQIAMCRSLDLGGSHFDARVGDQLGLDAQAANELRNVRLLQQTGRSDSVVDPATDRAVHEAVRPLMEELSREILMCLRYYGVTFKGRRPVRLILTGADACEPGLAASISERCGMTVEFDDEQRTLDGLATGLEAAGSRAIGPAAAWSVACGLSLRSLASRRVRRSPGQLERAA